MGSFNWHACKGKEWKGVLKEWLNLLKLMRNPRSLYQSQAVKEVLANRFVFIPFFFFFCIMFVLCGCCSINFLECNLEMLAPMIWSLLVLFKSMNLII